MPLIKPTVDGDNNTWGTKVNAALDYLDAKPSGRGIVSNVRTSGTGAAGTTDTYTITYTDATTSTYTVLNGANGADGSNVLPTDTAIKDAINNPASDTAAALSAKIGAVDVVPATRVQTWGHSYMSGVSTTGNAYPNDMATLLAADRKLPLVNKAVGGTALYNSLSADANWTSIFREVRRGTTYDQLTGLYPTMYGINDVGVLGNTSARIKPFTAALRACVSRFRAGAAFLTSHSSMSFGGAGTWSAAADIPFAGQMLRYNATAGATVTITTDASFPGGYVVPLFLSWSDAGAGAIFTGSNDATGYSVNTLDSASSGSLNVACVRIPATAGAHTFTFTTSSPGGSVGGACFGWHWEPVNEGGPMVPLVLQPKPVDYSAYSPGGPDGIPTDASMDVLNADIASIAAEFGPRVFTVDASIMDKSATYFVAGNVHPNNAGHAKLADLINTAIVERALTPSVPTDVLQGDPTPPPAWTAYTPTVAGSGTALGNGTVSGAYIKQSDGTVHFYVQFILGSTSTVGTTPNIGLPVPMLASQTYAVLVGFGQQAGVGFFALSGRSDTTTTVTPTTSTGAEVSASIPFAWAVNCVLEVRGTYRAA